MTMTIILAIAVLFGGAIIASPSLAVESLPSYILTDDCRDLQGQEKLINELLAQNRTNEAMRLAEEVHRCIDRTAAPDSDTRVVSHAHMGIIASKAGNFPRARAEFEAALAVLDAQAFPNPDYLEFILCTLGETCRLEQNSAKSEKYFTRCLALMEKRKRTRTEDYATSLTNYGILKLETAQYDEAEEKLKAAYEIRKRLPKVEPLSLINSIYNLAELARVRGQVDKAERLYMEARQRLEAIGLRNSLPYAYTLRNLAAIHMTTGRLDSAEALQLESLAIERAFSGDNHPGIAESLSNLATIRLYQGRTEEAIADLRKSIAIRQAIFKEPNKGIARDYNNLGGALLEMDRLAEAEKLLREAVDILQTSHVWDSPEFASVLQNLAYIYMRTKQYDETERLYVSGLRVAKARLDENHPQIAIILNGLGTLYIEMGRLDLAEVRFAEALAIWCRAPERNALLTYALFNNLAQLDDRQGRASAETLKGLLAIATRSYGPHHYATAIIYHNLAIQYLKEGRYRDAGRMVKKAIEIRSRTIGPSHPSTAESWTVLAVAERQQSKFGAALQASRAAIKALSMSRERYASTKRNSAGVGLMLEQRRESEAYVYTIGLGLLFEALGRGYSAELAEEAFRAAQDARASETALALARTAIRFETENTRLRALLRQRDALVRLAEKVEGDLLTLLSGPSDARNRAQEKEWRQQARLTEHNIERVDEELKMEFPSFSSYIGAGAREGVTLAQVRALLRPDEALFMSVSVRNGFFVIGVFQNQTLFKAVEIDREEAAGLVQSTRAGLDLSEVRTPAALRPFDFKAAHRLYDLTIGQIAIGLSGIDHVLIVPDGPLESLPFAVLVDRAYEGATFRAYQEAPWLGDRFGISTLPSVGNLVSLRKDAKPSQAREPFVGFGDPLFFGSVDPDDDAVFTRYGTPDLEKLRALRRLEGSGEEIKALAQSLGAPEGRLFLGRDATESRVRYLDRLGWLANFRVLAFATHAVTTGARIADGRAEPSLVLTAPDKATDEDDGIVSASEIASFSLDADWVILSACNTAGSDGRSSSRPLSGLARAFFAAGARSVLASHWSVETQSSAALTTALFETLRRRPGIRSASALRQAMRQVRDHSSDAKAAHPAFWSAFTIVGDGG